MEYQQAAMEAKPVEHHQQILDHFPFCGEQLQTSTVQLQLATNTIPPQIHPYHLQLAQPNLQDSNV